ncbi:alkaline-phosphatase-like protein [Fennellomyces sp. T-0311]|nr:alkaline-phosphatase-like protein [Fennellomyces sp. T-0311]
MNNSNYSAIPSDPDSKPLRRPPANVRARRIIAAAVICLVGSGLIASVIVLFTQHKSTVTPKRRNVIMMISDGFGPASETYARQYHGWREGLDPKAMLPLDHVHVGHSRTQSSSSLVTDSAAGATAFACALKSYNGAIGVDPAKKPCGTVLESAKIHHDMLTGLVVTSRITHATPASFSAHIDWRDREPEIAEQQIGHNPLGRAVDLMFGGGKCEFQSNTTAGSCRQDNRDLFEEAEDIFGWSVLHSRKEFDAIEASAPLPLLGLFASDHMSYEIDRDPSEQPSLKEMVTKALSILDTQSRQAGKGFFMMIEGSRIDMAAHSNDPAAHFHDIYEYHQTAQVVLDYIKEHPDTVMISTSDHETGGFTVGRQIGDAYPEYKWYPEVISRVRNSSEILSRAYDAAVKADTATADYLRKEILSNGLGINDPTDDELETLSDWKAKGKDVYSLENILTDMVSRRANIGWTTHGHTAVDVNLYAYGEGTEWLRGSHENTDIGDFISDYLKLDLGDITQQLDGWQALDVQPMNDEPKVSKHQMYHN